MVGASSVSVTYTRGDVILCDLNPVVGTEQAGIRRETRFLGWFSTRAGPQKPGFFKKSRNDESTAIFRNLHQV